MRQRRSSHVEPSWGADYLTPRESKRASVPGDGVRESKGRSRDYCRIWTRLSRSNWDSIPLRKSGDPEGHGEEAESGGELHHFAFGSLKIGHEVLEGEENSTLLYVLSVLLLIHSLWGLNIFSCLLQTSDGSCAQGTNYFSIDAYSIHYSDRFQNVWDGTGRHGDKTLVECVTGCMRITPTVSN